MNDIFTAKIGNEILELNENKREIRKNFKNIKKQANYTLFRSNKCVVLMR